MKKLGRFGVTCFGNRVKKFTAYLLTWVSFKITFREKDI